MSNRTFIIIVIAVVVLLLAAVYMHRPRSRVESRSPALHGPVRA